MIPTTSKIIIVGAGISGLSVAIALANKGYSVDVYERRTLEQTVQETGFSYPVGLTQDAQDILQYLGLDMRQSDQNFDTGIMRIVLNKKGMLKTYNSNTSKRLGTTRFLINQELYKLASSSRYKDKINLNYNSKCTQVDFNQKVIQVDNQNYRFDLLLACDGTNSFVRQQYQQYDGSLTLKKQKENKLIGVSDLPVVDGIPMEEEGRQNRINFVLAKQVMVVWKQRDSDKYSLFAQDRDGLEPQKYLNILADNLQNFFPPLWIKHLKSNPKFYENYIKLMTPNKLWGPNTIFLGDAGHPMTASAGIGIDTALGDIEVLMQIFEELQHLDQVPIVYNKKRLPPVLLTQDFEMMFQNISLARSGKQWYFYSVMLISMVLQQVNRIVAPQHIVFPNFIEVMTHPQKRMKSFMNSFKVSKIIFWGSIGTACGAACYYLSNRQQRS